MDSIEFIDMDDEMSPRIAAIKAGEIDSIDLASEATDGNFKLTVGDQTSEEILFLTEDYEGLRLSIETALNALDGIEADIEVNDGHLRSGLAERVTEAAPDPIPPAGDEGGMYVQSVIFQSYTKIYTDKT